MKKGEERRVKINPQSLKIHTPQGVTSVWVSTSFKELLKHTLFSCKMLSCIGSFLTENKET